MKQIITGFACINAKKEFIGIDTSSGYPWTPNLIQDIKIWKPEEKRDADEYARMFSVSDGMKVVPVQLTIETL